MKSDLMIIKNVVVVVHPKNSQANQIAKQLSSYLESDGKRVNLGKIEDRVLQEKVDGGEIDLLIALGGDGTMLRAGHLSAPHQIPILGINLGRFGFLTEIKKDAWQGALDRLMDGDYWLEERMMLKAGLWRKDKLLGEWSALNDVVVSRGETIRPIQLEIFVNERHLSTYVADAIITSTATGSTAYALAAGGPILSPELRNIVLVPVAPHLSVEQPLVLDENVSIAVSTYSEHQSVVSIDGQDPHDLKNEDLVKIRAGDYAVQFIRFQDPGYFYRNLIPYMDRNPSISNQHERNDK